MQKRSVLVFKDVNYGASKASATQNTAANPADLADGAVGIYGIMEGGATNLNKLVLITDGGSETAGFVPAASFVGKEVFIAQGVALTAGGSAVRLTPPISIDNPVGTAGGIRKNAGAKYSAPIRGVFRVGYNGTAGTSLNLPGTINRGDDFIVSLLNRAYVVAGAREPFQKVLLSVQTAANDTAYTILKKFVAAQNTRYLKNPIADNLLIDLTKLKIISNGTGSAAANSATLSAVNGATSLTASANHGISVGNWVLLTGTSGGANSDLYQAVAGTAATTLVLDRPYQGPTATIANANFLDTGSGTVPTLLGLEFVDNADYRNIEGAVQGIASNATLLRFTFPTPGTGATAEVVAYEKESLGKKGTEDQITRYQPLDIIYSQVAAANYDLYFFETRHRNQPTGQQGSVFGVINQIILAFVQGVADSTNKNQSDFEDAMGALFGTTNVPQISA